MFPSLSSALCDLTDDTIMALFHHKGTVHCLHNPTINPSVPQLWPGGSGEAQCNYISLIITHCACAAGVKQCLHVCVCVCVCKKILKNASSRVAKALTDVIVNEKQSA